jgi:hypothetical protein
VADNKVNYYVKQENQYLLIALIQAKLYPNRLKPL